MADAVALRRPEAVRLLVSVGFDVNGDGGTTPLHLAAYAGDVAMAALLLELGADPNRTDPAHRATPAGWAEHANAADVVALLAERAG